MSHSHRKYRNIILASIGTIVITLLGALLANVFSPVFSPLSEFIKDSISNKPVTKIISAMTFDNINKNISKKVNSGDTITSNSITFNFSSSLSNLSIPMLSHIPIEYFPDFECSFDGSPFEDCVSPKSYGNLNTEVGHSFQVRAKGLLGNFDKTPEKFYFTSITSASIEGIIKNNNTAESNAVFVVDSHSHKNNSTTDTMGRFQLEGIGHGKHNFIVYSGQEGPRKDYFFVPAGIEIMNVKFDVRNMSPVIVNKDFEQKTIDDDKIKRKNNKKSNANGNINSNNKKIATDNALKEINSNVSLAAQNEYSNNSITPFFTSIWLNATEGDLSKIDKVTYYLPSTFEPNMTSVFTKENNFRISLNHDEKFNVKAIAFFKDHSNQTLEIPSNKWNLN